MALKHNKKLNVPLIREMLVREMASYMIAEDASGVKKCFDLIAEMRADKVLSECLDAFDAFKGLKGSVNKDSASKYLGMIVESIGSKETIANRAIRFANKITKSLGSNFFDKHRVSDYKIYASANVYMNNFKNCAPVNINELIKHENMLVSYLCESNEVVEKKHEGKIDGLVCSFLHEEFNKTYGKELLAEQFSLLEKYIKYSLTNDNASLVRKVNEERVRILKELKASSSVKEVVEDTSIKSRLNEVINLLENFDSSSINDDKISDLLSFQELVVELKS